MACVCLCVLPCIRAWARVRVSCVGVWQCWGAHSCKCALWVLVCDRVLLWVLLYVLVCQVDMSARGLVWWRVLSGSGCISEPGLWEGK